MYYDRIIIGAGIYGLYAAEYCGKLGHTVLVIECENAPFTRASYINQARLHMGYHYPRSYSTAIKTAQYFDRFVDDFKDSINNEFDQVYATSTNFSWTNKKQFIKFCNNANIRCDNINPEKYFNNDICDGAYLTKEYAFDAEAVKTTLLNRLSKLSNVDILYNTEITSISKDNSEFSLVLRSSDPPSGSFDLFSGSALSVSTKYILNSTYASTNQIQSLAKQKTFQIKYELCEVILCKVSDNFKNVGITVMDGPFFSIMPFGNTGYHTLTSVTFTPHISSHNTLPTFDCQAKSDGYCTPERLGNCNTCPVKPKSAWQYMSTLAKKYVKPGYEFEYVDSLYSMKPILKASEIDDSRPTLIYKSTENPTFVSVLSGKINTIYDIEEVLKDV
ncbi:MAG: FAD-binding oxidoreductase [Oscillospiraceae bacterium]|nr:FAD-binding oxidoreductase [Oscillospiraceae bacterium]